MIFGFGKTEIETTIKIINECTEWILTLHNDEIEKKISIFKEA